MDLDLNCHSVALHVAVVVSHTNGVTIAPLRKKQLCHSYVYAVRRLLIQNKHDYGRIKMLTYIIHLTQLNALVMSCIGP